MQPSFLDAYHREDMSLAVQDWQVPELPVLDGMDEIFMDLESTGLRWFEDDRLIGAGILLPNGQEMYLPVRHKVGPNIPLDKFFLWCSQELKHKRITNLRTKFDLHLLRADNVDLEAQGCTFGDVSHYAALLDDHRRTFNQEDLVRDFLGSDAGKMKETHGFALDPARFADYPAGLIAPRACHDVRMVKALQTKMWPMLTEQDLHRVREIEDAVIPAVVEMEHNGAPIDLVRLRRYLDETLQIVEALMLKVQRESGVGLTSFTRAADLVKVFNQRNIPVPTKLERVKKYDEHLQKYYFVTEERQSFEDDLLKPIQDQVVQDIRAGRQFTSLRSKFLVKYWECAERTGILRYELHQLPYQEGDGDDGGGAVSGRFSSAAVTLFDDTGKRFKFGANIQQVFGVATQEDEDKATGVKRGFTRDYLVKDLIIPSLPEVAATGCQWLKADASQFQFRIFADYAGNDQLIAAYADDILRSEQGRKLVDFHEVVQELIKAHAGKDLRRTHVKNVNFAQLFGAGIDKMAEQLAVEVAVAQEISDIYHEMFPEVKKLLKETSHLAMPEHKVAKDGRYGCGWACQQLYRKGYTHRGFVRTKKGRRARFGPRDRHYSALNRIIQGTEGDFNKVVMTEIHKHRYELELIPRFTVHDEWSGTSMNPAKLKAFKKLINTQYFPEMKVPILWEAGVGPSWGQATEKI